MKINGKFVWEDYLKAQLLHIQQPIWIRVVSYVFFGLVGVILLWGLFSSFSATNFILYVMPVLILVVFFPLYRFVLLPRQSRRIFDQSKELSLPIEFEITEAGMQVSNEMGSSLRPWNSFHKWKEGKDLLLLYFSDVGFLMIPKRFFSDPQQIETLKSHLVQNQVKPARNPYAWISVLVFLLIMIAVGITLYSSLAGGGG